jgi:hypothetical protein
MKEWLVNIIVTTIALLAPIHALIIAVSVLILADFITGILAAIRRKEKVSSASMRRTISKLIVYQIAIITGFVLETYLLSSIFPVAKLVAGVIGLVEFKSILENANCILGGHIFTAVLEKLGSENDPKYKK